MTLVRYQVRFARKGERLKPNSLVIIDEAEIRKYKQYFFDIEFSCRLDDSLSLNEKKKILEQVKDFGWNAERPILVKEPIDNTPK